ncbi:hypothetical protein [Caproicibacter fermentans]|uniref:hypothetical protein n=1 Tax=Caproicibacter fermentans TaxID=2576756 RepID=UPI00226B3B35|nr:hypothetical protein [Caproicibacter fermentans]
MLVAGSPELDLLGVTVTAGNAPGCYLCEECPACFGLLRTPGCAGLPRPGEFFIRHAEFQLLF